MIDIKIINGRITLDGDSTGIIEGDSDDYNILSAAAAKVAHLEEPTLEMGVRYGLSSVIIMDQNNNGKMHIAIDPYGNIQYADDVHGVISTDYSNEMRNKCQYALTKWAYENNKSLMFLPIEDTEYMRSFAHGVPIYTGYSKKSYQYYSLVHFDGPHTTDAVITEFDFFKTRMARGGMMVFDDIKLYNHDRIEQMLHDNGFIVIEKGERKASYMNVKK